ncbi:TPA: hypothetical protein N0F65_012153, partial [Lagenidium giganteum]
IQLGGANDGICHFLSLGGFEMLLDCGAHMQSLTSPQRAPALKSSADPLRINLPAIHTIDVESLDIILISNHLSLLALPFLTESLGFKGTVYATELTMAFGRLLLEELATAMDHRGVVLEYGLPHQHAIDRASMNSVSPATLRPLRLADIRACCAKIETIEFKEIKELSYGVTITALSSGFSLGACMWLIESPNDRLAYVPAASGDLNRHPKELDFAPLIDCETLLLTDLKPDRDPHTSTERMVERFLSSITRVLDRNGVCIIPRTPCGVLFDLIEATYAGCCHHKQQPVPMYLMSPHAVEAMDLTLVGPEWLCEKKTGKLYVGDYAFLHSSLIKNKVLHPVPEITSQMLTALQNGGIVFAGHPSLRFGPVKDLLQLFGHDNRNALLLSEPYFDMQDVLAPFSSLELEKIMCPIDARLSCGDANQFITRCCPRNLLVPVEFTRSAMPQRTAIDSSGNMDQERQDTSHFSHVLPLSELTIAKPKTDPTTVAMKLLEPIVLDKSAKYVDGRLDPRLAAKTVLTDVGGKAAAYVSGVLRVKRKSFVLQERPDASSSSRASPASVESSSTNDRSKTNASRRKSSMANNSAGLLRPPVIEYREKTNMLLGSVDEEKLSRQIKSHDPNAQVFISQSQDDAELLMSIPSMDARITLAKAGGRTMIETEKEESRALLTTLVLAQLAVIHQ